MRLATVRGTMSAFDLDELRRLSEAATAAHKAGDSQGWFIYGNQCSKYLGTHREAIIARLEAADALAESMLDVTRLRDRAPLLIAYLACAKHDAALNDPRLSENDRARIQKHLADAIKERTEAKLEEFSEARHLIYLEKELTALRAKVAAGDELRKFVDAVANGSVWNAKDSAQFALANFDRAVKP